MWDVDIRGDGRPHKRMLTNSDDAVAREVRSAMKSYTYVSARFRRKGVL